MSRTELAGRPELAMLHHSGLSGWRGGEMVSMQQVDRSAWQALELPAPATNAYSQAAMQTHQCPLSSSPHHTPSNPASQPPFLPQHNNVNNLHTEPAEPLQTLLAYAEFPEDKTCRTGNLWTTNPKHTSLHNPRLITDVVGRLSGALSLLGCCNLLPCSRPPRHACHASQRCAHAVVRLAWSVQLNHPEDN